MKSVKVISIRKVQKPKYVGDIGVCDNHNLFVSSNLSDKSILVHNCWGIISKDPEIAKSFRQGKNLRLAYRKNPTPKNKEKVVLGGDPHRINYNMFTGTPIKDITSEQRVESKGITFGSMYGMSVRSLAKELNKGVEYVQKIYNKFFEKFSKAAHWLEWVVGFAERNMYIFSPLGRRRNLSGYLSGSSVVTAALGRRAKNSPIQGMASDFGFMAARIFSEKLYEVLIDIGRINPKKDMPILEAGVNVMVHDSIETETPYDLLPIVVHLMEWSATVGVRDYVKRIYNMDFIVGLEVDFNIGTTGDKMYSWDFSKASFYESIEKSLIDQRDILKYDINVENTLQVIKRSKKQYKEYLNKNFPLDLNIV